YRVKSGLKVTWPKGSPQQAFLGEGITGDGTLQFYHQLLLFIPADGAPRALGQYGGVVGADPVAGSGDDDGQGKQKAAQENGGGSRKMGSGPSPRDSSSAAVASVAYARTSSGVHQCTARISVCWRRIVSISAARMVPRSNTNTQASSQPRQAGSQLTVSRPRGVNVRSSSSASSRTRPASGASPTSTTPPGRSHAVLYVSSHRSTRPSSSRT